MKATTNELPSQVSATNYDEIKRIVKVYDDITKVKVSEERWEEPEGMRVLHELNMGASPRVQEELGPEPMLQNDLDDDELIVASNKGSRDVILM